MSETSCLVSIPWETRNLGVQSFTLSERFLESPEEATLRDALKEKRELFGSIFVQARLSKQCLPAARCLERSGFYFVESTLVPSSILKKNPRLQEFAGDARRFVPQRYLLDDLRLFHMDKGGGEHCQRVREIAAESFSDDRFHMDVKCSKEVADRRFIYWVEDLLGDQAVAFDLLEYRGEVISFMARRGENLVLAGFSGAYVRSGLGDYFWLGVLHGMQRQGFMQARTLISTSNTAVLNLYARIGFKFSDPAATFHYWSV